MTEAKIIEKVKELEALSSLMNNTLTVLKREVLDGGASGASARKGKKEVLSAKEVAKIKAKRQKARMRTNNH